MDLTSLSKDFIAIIDCDFEEKDIVKALGCKWCSAGKQWQAFSKDIADKATAALAEHRKTNPRRYITIEVDPAIKTGDSITYTGHLYEVTRCFDTYDNAGLHHKADCAKIK